MRLLILIITLVTQGIRDRKTLRVNYSMAAKKGAGGEVNPATRQSDRSSPFFRMEITWK